jgi:glutamate-1-semialdehyde 2,1-aminomutase
MDKWKIDGYDRTLSQELQASLPDKMFDMHAHPYLLEDIDTDSTPILRELPQEGGIDGWKEIIGFQVGKERLKGGLFFGLPILKGNPLIDRIRHVNHYIRTELDQAKDIQRRGLLMVSHLMDPSELEAGLKSPWIAGFKPYVTLNPGCTFASDIPAYLPEWACELANQRDLVITLHLMKPESMNDSRNIAEIKRLCRTYPRMKLILAHAGCGFNMYNTINGVHELTGIDNLWFDISAVCEAPPVISLIKKYGSTRLMWGTDYPVSLRKGRIVTMGDRYFGIQNNTILPEKIPEGCNMALLGLEAIRASVYATGICDLSASEVENIYYNNAAGLLNIK